MSLFKESAEKLGITYQEIMKERLAMARDKKVAASVRNDIYKEFFEKFEQIDEDSEKHKPLPHRRLPELPRSIECWEKKDE